MKPPSRVKVGPHLYRLVVDADAIARVSAEAEQRKLGECEPRTCTITIDPDQHPSQLADTVIHECLHAAFDVIGAMEDVSDEIEERLVRRLAPVLLQILTDNPGLVAWLTEE